MIDDRNILNQKISLEMNSIRQYSLSLINKINSLFQHELNKRLILKFNDQINIWNMNFTNRKKCKKM